MKRIVPLLVALLLVTGVVAHPPTPPGKWKAITDTLINKSSDVLKFTNSSGDTLVMYKAGNNWYISGENSTSLVDSALYVRNGGSGSGDLTAVVAGAGMTGTSLDGPIPTLNVIGGDGITVSANAVAADLGTAIVSSEITDDEIVNADINSAAAIAYSKLAFSNNIVAGDIATSAVATAEILNATILEEDLADDIIDSLNVKDLSLQPGDIAAGGASDGQVMKWSDGTGKWVPSAAGGTDVWTEIDGAAEDSAYWIAPDADTALKVTSSGSGDTHLRAGLQSSGAPSTLSIAVDTISRNPIFTGDATFDDGDGSSPYALWRDQTGNYFSIEQQDNDGSARLFAHSGKIHLYSDGDNNDPLTISTSLGVTTIATVETGDDGDLIITSGGGHITLSDSVTIGAYTLPIIDGTVNYVLKTDGSGAVSWAADEGAGGALSYWTESQDTDTSIFVPNTNTKARFTGAPIVFDGAIIAEGTATFEGNVVADGNLSIGNAATSAGVLTLLEDDDAGTNFASFMAPALGANTVYTLPSDDGDNTEQLTTDGSGVLSWAAAGAGSGETNTLADTGTFNGTEGFGLTQTKVGTELRVRGLIEGTGITIANIGAGVSDTGLSITATLGTDITAAEIADGDHGSFTYISNAAVLDAGVVTSTQILDQAIKGDDIDSTGENFVFDDAYRGTSAVADSAYVTANTINDSLNLTLRLAGGEMSGNITMSGNETVDGVDISDWIDQDVTSGSSPTFDATNITGIATGTVEQTHINVRAGTATITKGFPVYATSYNVSGWWVVEKADASDPTKMPAIAIADVDITTTATVDAVVTGRTTGLVTDTITDGLIDSALFVAEGGGLTVTKPTGSNLIQKVAIFGRSHSSAGVILVVGAGRTNDVPNFSAGPNYIWAAAAADSSAIQIDLDSAIAATALLKTGGAMTGAITTNSTFDGVDVAGLEAVVAADSSAWRLAKDTVAAWDNGALDSTNFGDNAIGWEDIDTLGSKVTDVDTTGTFIAAALANRANVHDTLTKSFVIGTPIAADDFPFWQTEDAITLIEVVGICVAGTNVIGQLQEYTGGAVTPAATMTSDVTFLTTEVSNSTWSNATIDAGDWLGWKTTSVSGSVTHFCLTIRYKVD